MNPNNTWNKPDKKPDIGFLVTIFAWPFYISNAAILLCPLLVALFKRLKRARIALTSLVVLYIVTPFMTLLFVDAILDVDVGFYFWVGSYFAAAIGTAFAIKLKRQNEQDVSPKP